MIPKHGKDSARTKKCKNYKEKNRRFANKEKHKAAQSHFAYKQQAKKAAKKN